MEASNLTREELYELVWSEPATTLSERFRISDVALTKTCRRHRVPKPGRGHWQRVAAGQKVRRPRLPELGPAERELAVVTIGAGKPPVGSPEVQSVVEKRRVYEADPKNRITVPKVCEARIRWSPRRETWHRVGPPPCEAVAVERQS